ncbi:hypothetical protein ABS71_08555 [bacterium SCN 62-11]|nr:hypothetical protein [Candidatus Eremiobacteraeota bacterium]ODT70417.1 MAG: hypothetical protein ABS71_08555 [bacterium SCN 62-11]
MLHVMLVTCLIFFFSLAVINLGLFHYQAAQRQSQSMRALEAAQAGLAAAVGKLSSDPRVGVSPVVVAEDLSGGGRYRVSFGAGESVNNLAGFLPATGWRGRVVPAHCAHVVAEGFSLGGGHRTVEAVVHLEALPFPVQSMGAVTGHTMTVAGASSAALFQSDGARLPGSIYGGAGVALDGVGVVTGGVRSAGAASVAPTVVVTGEVEQHTEPLDVPDLDISTFDNSSTPGVRVLTSGTYTGVLPLRGSIYVEGDVRFVGPVVLDSAMIYVGNGGNLEVNGLMTGKGTLFVTGKTTLSSSVMVNDDSQIAIFSQNDLEVTNHDLPLVSVFQGVLYSHGRIKLGPAVTVLGAVISRADLEFAGLNQIVNIPEHSAFASFWLARGAGGAPMKLDYWAELP